MWGCVCVCVCVCVAAPAPEREMVTLLQAVPGGYCNSCCLQAAPRSEGAPDISLIHMPSHCALLCSGGPAQHTTASQFLLSSFMHTYSLSLSLSLTLHL